METIKLNKHRQGVTIKIRPPIFRKKIENDKNTENFKGNFRL